MNNSPHPYLRILLVEDSNADALLLQQHLERSELNFELIRSTSRQEALRILAQGGVDFVITDYRLPGEDGLAIIRAFHELDPDLPCILVSGQVGEDIAVEALHAGARDFLLKGNLARLVPAILREQAETAHRRHRRALERAQIRQAQFLQTLLDTLPSPVFFKDCKGCYLGCNRAFEQAFGISRSELQGKTVFDIMPKPIADRFYAQDNALFAHPGIQSYSSQVLFADGSLHEVVFYKATFADEDSQGLVGTLLDVTNLVEIQNALRLSEDRYRRILQVTQEGILTTDKDFRLTFVNSSLEKMLGEPANRLLQQPLETFLCMEDLEEKKAGRTEGKFGTYEGALRLSNGEERFVLVSATPITGSDGQFEGVFAMLTDITDRRAVELERQQMEVQLRHAQKLEAIGQLAAGIAHEINTPIQYIGDNAVFLQDAFTDVLEFLGRLQCETSRGELPDPTTLKARIEALDLGYLKEEIPRAIQQTLEGVSRVSKIVSAMKDFSHPGGATQERVDLNRAIESTITVCRNEWKYVATLEQDLDPDLPEVACFPGEFNQVILNLLVNAAHAIEESLGGKDSGRMGLIRVSTRKQQDTVEIRISDTGIGIAKELQTRIFEPFFTTKAVGKGTGQGLSIARAVIVDKHKGQIDLRSAPGEGSTFILRLPLVETP
jgi:PAS domain S-box-containing protein